MPEVAAPTVAPSDGQVISQSRFDTQVVQTCAELPNMGIVTSELQVINRPKPVKKLAIVGKAPSSLGLAPYMDREWSIWGLSDGWRNMPRPVNANDVWFELHDIDTGRKKRWPPEYFEWLRQHQDKLPIYLGHKLRVNKYAIADMTLEECKQLDSETRPHKDLPHCRMYPVYEILWRYGIYFNNSISFMMALALLESEYDGNPRKVSLFGVDMAQSDPVMGQNGEYEHQRPSCEFVLGLLWGKFGRENVYVPGEADLLKCKKLYAFESHGNEDEEEKKRLARRQELIQAIQKNEQQIQQLQTSIVARKGAIDQMDYDYRRSR